MTQKNKKTFTWSRSGALGDCIMTFNLLKNFREKHPGAKVVYKCHPKVAEILHDLVFQMGFDHIITDVNQAFGEQINLVGYPVNFENPKLGHPWVPMKRHLIEYFADELGVAPDFNSLVLPKPKPVMDGPYVTMHVKTLFSHYKDWPLEKFNDLAWRLKQEDIKVLQVGGPNDPEIPNAFGRIKVTNGPDQPRVLFNTNLAAIAHSRLHIGLDSFASHLLNVQWDGGERVPGLILWGSSSVKATGYPTNTNMSLNLPCAPCFREDPAVSDSFTEPCPIDHKCMKELTVDSVHERVYQMLRFS